MEESDPTERPSSPAEDSGQISSSSETESRQQKFQVTPEQKPLSKPVPAANIKSAPPDLPPAAARKAPRRSRRWRISKASETYKIVLIFGPLMLFGGVFYVGKKYEYWKYRIATRKDAELVAKMTSEFTGASADELVENAIVAERLGNWNGAARRFVAAKYKNPALGGVLFLILHGRQLTPSAAQTMEPISITSAKFLFRNRFRSRQRSRFLH